MGSVEIIVGQNWKHDVQFLKDLRRFHRFQSELNLIEIRDIIDIVINGKNITGHIAEESIFGVLYELLGALGELIEGPQHKAVIEFICEPWEMTLERRARDILVSVYSIDRHHQVLAHDLQISAHIFIQALSRAAESLLTELFRISENFSTDHFVRDFSARLGKLKNHRRARFSPEPGAKQPSRGWCQGGTSSPAGWTLSYRFDADYPGLRDYCGGHEFDLHALLAPGEVLAEVDGELLLLMQHEGYERDQFLLNQRAPARGGYPILSVYALLRRCRQLLNLLETGRDERFECVETLEHFNLGVKARGSAWTLILGDPGVGEGVVRSIKSNPRDALDMLLSLAEMLLGDLHALNPLLELNQRWSDLDREARELRGWFEDLAGGNAYHDEPESFIEAMGHLAPQPVPRAQASFSREFSSLQALFSTKTWQFKAAGIDFRNLLVTPEMLVAPTERALYGVDLGSGEARWEHDLAEQERLGQVQVGAGAVVVSRRLGLRYLDIKSGALLAENAELSSHDWGHLLGAAVYPGEERLVACDSRGHLFGLCASSGALQWSFSSGHGRFIGARSWGPLIFALTGEGFLFALNPLSGELLWKIRLGGLADISPQVHQGRLYALTHDSLHQKLTVHSLYPFTGRSAWQLRLDGVLAGPIRFAGDWLILPVESHGQLQLRGIDIERPEPQVEWRLDLSSAGIEEPSPILYIPSEDEERSQNSPGFGIIKTDRAETTCFKLRSGEISWRVTPDDEDWLLQGGSALVRIKDAFFSSAKDLEIRSLEDGRLLHALGMPTAAPELIHPYARLSLLVGARDSESNGQDLLYGLSLNHYLARIK